MVAVGAGSSPAMGASVNAGVSVGAAVGAAGVAALAHAEAETKVSNATAEEIRRICRISNSLPRTYSGCLKGTASAGAGKLSPGLPKTQVQGRHDEQVEQRRSDQAAHNDDGHGELDLAAGNTPGNHQGYQGQPGGERRHHDRRNPFARPALDQLGAEGLAFLLL